MARAASFALATQQAPDTVPQQAVEQESVFSISAALLLLGVIIVGYILRKRRFRKGYYTIKLSSGLSVKITK
jgi:hypothetical protein